MADGRQGLPYWRLSAFYLFYFGALGALIPYWGLYLKDRGFGVEAIGQLMAVLMVTKTVAPYVWGWLGDHHGNRIQLVRFASLVAAITYLGVYFAPGFWELALVMLVFSFFWNAALPQFEVTTMLHLGRDTHRYAQIRLWGSVGFVITAASVGPLLQGIGSTLLPAVVFVMFIGIWLSSLLATDAPEPQHDIEQPGSILKTLARPAVAAFLLLAFLMQASHGPFYAFFSIYLENHGYSRSMIGVFWAGGVVAEVLMFIVMHRLLVHMSLRTAVLLAMAAAVVRWWVIAFWVESAAAVWFTQALHAATFGIFHAVAIQIVYRLFPSKQQGRGQALYSSASFGAGGAVGSLGSGYIWAHSSPGNVFLAAAVVAFVGLLVTWVWLRGPALERDFDSESAS